MTAIPSLTGADQAHGFPPPSVTWGPWRAEGQAYSGAAPTDYLVASVTIAGVHHHAEAIAIEPQGPDDTAPQRAVAAMQDEFDAICSAAGIDGRFLTVKIGGRDYALIITPGIA